MTNSIGFSGVKLACLRGGRVVFTGLDFRLAPGNALLLTGPNGSGKSSLLRLMAGLLPPAAGMLAWNGSDISDDREAHVTRLHYVGHHDAVKPVLNVAEILGFWAGLQSGGDENAVTQAIERFGLAHLADIPGRMLSAGQRRRLNLARLLASPAPLWLLDEPSTALDRASVGVLENILAEHREGGGMVVLSTHTDIDLPGAESLRLDRFAPSDEWAESFG